MSQGETLEDMRKRIEDLYKISTHTIGIAANAHVRYEDLSAQVQELALRFKSLLIVLRDWKRSDNCFIAETNRRPMTNGTGTDVFWRAVTMLVRLDMAAGIVMTATLLAWLTWIGAR